MSNFSVDGLVTGLNTSSIIDSLMRLERAPLTVMTRQKTAYDMQATAWNDIRSVLSSLSTAANDLATAQKLALFSATSSSPTVATATVTAGAAVAPSSITLRVDALATAHQMASAGATSSSAALGAGTTTLGVGIPALGLNYVKADGSIAAGAHNVTVTQASAGATITGTAWAGTVTIGSTNNSLNMTVNGTARTVTIASGTYTSQEALAAAVQTAVGTDVRVASVGGRLQFSTAREGSQASLRFQNTTNNALSTIGHAQGGTVNGTNGIVTVDGVTNTLNNINDGAQLTLNGSGGTLTIRTAGGVDAGSATVYVIRSAAADTLTDLAADITAASSSVRTQVIDTGSGTNPARLVASAASTGLANAFTLEFGGYTGIADGAETITQGRNASVRLGGVSVSRASNTLTDLVAGVSINLQSAQPGTDVTITLDRDVATLSATAKALVDSLNAALTKINTLTKYDADKNIAAVLQGDSRATDIKNSLLTAMQEHLSAGAIQSLPQIGISLSRAGTYSFDSAKFDAAVKSDYTSVTQLLARTGVASDARVGYIGASASTLARTWPFSVVITQAAEQASVTGNSFGTLGQAETIAVTTIGGTVTYQALGGQDAATVVAGLNAALSSANAGATASVVGGAIKITTTGYGASQTLSVTAGAGTGLNGKSDTGVNVAGTIDGQAAAGSGQVLTAGTGDANGLMLKITATPAEVSGAGGTLGLGTVSYTEGAVGGLSRLLGSLTGTGGKVSASHDNAVEASKAQQERIDSFESRLELVQARYSRQFAALETLMGQLRDQGAWLAAQISGLPGWS